MRFQLRRLRPDVPAVKETRTTDVKVRCFDDELPWAGHLVMERVDECRIKG